MSIVNDIKKIMRQYERSTPSIDLFFRVYDEHNRLLSIDDNISAGLRMFETFISSNQNKINKIELSKKFNGNPIKTLEERPTRQKEVQKFNGFGGIEDAYGGLQGFINEKVESESSKRELIRLNERIDELKEINSELKTELKDLKIENRELDSSNFRLKEDVIRAERNGTMGAVVIEGLAGFATKKLGIDVNELAGVGSSNEHVEIQVENQSQESTSIKNLIDSLERSQAYDVIKKIHRVLAFFSGNVTALENYYDDINTTNHESEI